MLMKLRLHNVSDFITNKFAPPTFLRRSFNTIVSPAKDEEDFIYLFIIDIFSEYICVTDYTSSVIKEY